MKPFFNIVLALVALLPALAFSMGLPSRPASGQDDDQQSERHYTNYGVMFYNLENMFDTINNNGRQDYELCASPS